MQMRPRRSPRLPHVGDDLTRLDLLACGDADVRAIGVEGGQPATVQVIFVNEINEEPSSVPLMRVTKPPGHLVACSPAQLLAGRVPRIEMCIGLTASSTKLFRSVFPFFALCECCFLCSSLGRLVTDCRILLLVRTIYFSSLSGHRAEQILRVNLAGLNQRKAFTFKG